jgi:hypothetical protein
MSEHMEWRELNEIYEGLVYDGLTHLDAITLHNAMAKNGYWELTPDEFKELYEFVRQRRRWTSHEPRIERKHSEE